MMKRYILFTLLISISFGSYTLGQNETAIKIGDREISLGEFERLYKKNSAAISLESQDLEEYLERFINFKLKVIEAENAGNDTTESFLNELNGYRRELAKPYMMDSAYIEELLYKAYNKIKKEVNASHILININENSPPADTLSAWNKIMQIRGKALSGEDFGKLAEQNSNDPSAVNTKGNLGWFAAFRMVPEFEDVAFTISPGSISMPVRTRFGYHIIKVHENRPARGSVRVAHIYLGLPEGAPAEEAEQVKDRIYKIYNELKEGEEFAEMARIYSDDRASAEDGGKLQWFTSGVMIPEFENGAFSLNSPGQFSEPIRSFFGWHIIQLIEKKTVGTFEEVKEELQTKINSDSYNAKRRAAFIEKLKKEHSYSFNDGNLKNFHTYIDSSFFEGTWSASSIPNPDRVLLSVGTKKYSVLDFGKYLEDMQKPAPGTDFSAFVNRNFQKFSEEAVYNYEESTLESKYPEFKYIFQEYHDGILLFDLTDKMVWSKAVNDTTGLEKFYKKNRKNYSWDKRAEAFIINVKDPSLVSKARSYTEKMAKRKDFSKDFLLQELCPVDTLGTCADVVFGKFEKGENAMIDAVGWKKGIKDNVENNGDVSFIFIRKILKPTFKKLDETRGLVISDYQEYLEKQWVRELRKKYPFTVYRDVISKIK